MILFDTETTGLPKAEGSDLDIQPSIIEFGAIKYDDEMNEIDRIEFFCNPGHDLDPQIVKITGINDSMLAGEHPFVAHYNNLCEFFLGEKTLVAHNLPFDRKILKFDLERIDKLLMFPWPPEHVCTVEVGERVWGKKRKLGEIYQEVTGQEHKNAHRAIQDVLAMAEVVKWYKMNGHMS